MRILIYGTSNKALLSLPSLALKHEILGFIDSNPVKLGTTWLNTPVYHPSELYKLEFDKIIIASSYKDEINQILREYDLPQGIHVDEISIIKSTQNAYDNALRDMRRRDEAQLPKQPLCQRHINGTRLLTNRETLLEHLPKGGIVAEIGVAAGEFSRAILDISKPQKIHLVDSWGSDRYGDDLYASVQTKFRSEVNTKQVIIHRKTSLDAISEFPDHYFDWVYIDTTHSYELTRNELKQYAKKIKQNGFLAGHDYQQVNWSSLYRNGVIEAVHEFCVEEDYRIRYITMDISECQSFAIQKILSDD
jgi:hypothetical protein